jgi:hypothetical protein
MKWQNFAIALAAERDFVTLGDERQTVDQSPKVKF